MEKIQGKDRSSQNAEKVTRVFISGGTEPERHLKDYGRMHGLDELRITPALYERMVGGCAIGRTYIDDLLEALDISEWIDRRGGDDVRFIVGEGPIAGIRDGDDIAVYRSRDKAFVSLISETNWPANVFVGEFIPERAKVCVGK